MKAQKPQHKFGPGRGYTLLEALLLVIILGIVGAGVGTNLRSLEDHSEGDNNAAQVDVALVTQMETLRATWASRGVGLLNSTITIGGASYPASTDVEHAAPNSSGNQSTFYVLTVTIGGRSMATYVSG